MTSAQTPMPSFSAQQIAHRAAIALSLALLWSIIAIALLRSGLGDGGLFLLAVTAFGLAAIWLPLLAFPAHTGDATPRPVAAGLAMLLGPILPILGLALGAAATVLMAALVFLILVRNRRLIAAAVAGKSGRSTLLGFPLLVGVFLVVSGASWRVYLPEALVLGIGQADSYFHVAIAQIFAAFKVPSTGGDGLALQHYHFGSHVAAAGLAEAAGSRASLVYAYWGLILLKAQLLWALVWASLILAGPGQRTGSLYLLFGYPSIFLLLGPLESESFMLAMAVFAGITPLICHLFTTEERSSRSYTFGVWLLFAAAFVCAAAKVSIGYFCAVALGWLAWNGRARHWPALLLVAALAGLAAFTMLFVLPFEQSLHDSGMGILLGSYAQYASSITLLSYMLPCIVVWAWLHELRLSAGPPELPANARTRVTLQFSHTLAGTNLYRRLLESPGLIQLQVLCLAACGLLLVCLPIGNGMAYFSYLLLFLPAMAAPGWLYAGYAAAPRMRRLTIAVGALGILYLSVAFGFNLATGVSTLARATQQQAIAELRDANDSAGLGRRVVARSWRETGTLFGHLRTQIGHTQWAALIAHIEAAKAGNRLRVFVPPANEEFWTRLRPGAANPYWCMQAHLMIPGQSGTPMILGIPPLKFEGGCSPIPGIYGFGKYQDLHRTRDVSDRNLCEVARLRDVQSVYVLNSISALDANRIVRCDAGSAGG